MNLVIAAVVGTSIGYFLTHPPEWFLRTLGKILGVER
jgi:hypothetical protein